MTASRAARLVHVVEFYTTALLGRAPTLETKLHCTVGARPVLTNYSHVFERCNTASLAAKILTLRMLV